MLALTLGGASRYGLFAHGVLQSVAALGIAWLIVSWPRSVMLDGVKTPLCIFVALALIGVFQLVPMPVDLWTVLPGRTSVVEGYLAMDVPLVQMPISLDPESTLQSLGYVLPPLFVLLLSVRVGLRRLKRIVPGALSIIGLISVLMGITQIYMGRASFLYLYDNTNFESPVGPFANVNHFSAMLLMILPFTIFSLRELSFERTDVDRTLAWAATLICTLLLLTAGIGSAGSLAIYLMTPPLAGLAWLGTRTRAQSVRTSLLTGSAVLFVATIAVIAVSTSPVLDGLGVTGASDNPTSRQNMWTYTLEAIEVYWPVGSGIGTYQSVIPLFEDPDLVTSRYIATAHNEYLQVLMETGASGMLVLLVALGWLLLRMKDVWYDRGTASTDNFRKMALLGILACVFHSIVDYPIRTPALASLLALYIAIVALPKIEQFHSAEAEVKKPENPKRVVL